MKNIANIFFLLFIIFTITGCTGTQNKSHLCNNYESCLAEYRNSLEEKGNDDSIVKLRKLCSYAKADSYKEICSIEGSDSHKCNHYKHDLAHILSRCGDLYSFENQYPSAINYYKDAISVVPANEYCNKTGDLFLSHKDFEQAIYYYSKVQGSKDYFDRGLAYEGLEKYANAIADYERSRIIWGHVNLTNTKYVCEFACLLKTNYLDIFQPPDKYGKDLIVKIELGNVASFAENYDEAINTFEEAIKMHPQEASLYIIRAGTYILKGEYSLAIKDIDNSVKIAPRDPGILNASGLEFAVMGKYDEALVFFNRAIEFSQVNAEVYYNRGIVYKKIGDKNNAIDDLLKYLSLKPDSIKRDDVLNIIQSIRQPGQ